MSHHKIMFSFQIPKSKIPCKICGKEYRQIVQHYKLEHLPTKYSSVPCYVDNCELQFNSIVALKSHAYRSHSRKTNTPGFQFNCLLCEKILPNNKYF